MRQAEFESPIEIAATAVFGAVDIIVRPDTEVDLSGTAILGSKDVKGARADGSGARDSVRVNAFTVFGGVSVTRKG